MSHWKHTITGIDFSNYPLWQREQIFRQVVLAYYNEPNIEDALYEAETEDERHEVLRAGIDGEVFEQPPLCIAWEDPADPDAPMKVTTPSPVWWAMALHGGILPPVEAYHELAKDEAQPGFTRHSRGYLLHKTQPMPPMTPEQAMTYLVQKDIPPRVWRDYRGNRTILRIVPREAIPTDRTNRNAWRMKEIAA